MARNGRRADAESGGTATKIVEYAYDHGQRWVRKTLDTDADGTIEELRVFVHDDGQIVLDFEKAGTGAASNSDLAHRYLWGNSVDQLLADERADDGSEDDVAYALTDHLNSVRDLVVYDPVTQTVSVVKHMAYDTFGNVSSDSATGLESLFLFTARPFDSDTDLQNNLNRWYDLATGRWMSVDPIGFIAGDVNLYRYVGNTSSCVSDPLGLADRPIFPGDPPVSSPTIPPGVDDSSSCGKWESGGKWTFRDISVTNARTLGETFAKKKGDGGWWSDATYDSIPILWLDAGWWLIFDFATTAELKGTIRCCDGSSISIDIQAEVELHVEQKMRNRVGFAADMAKMLYLPWWVKTILWADRGYGGLIKYAEIRSHIAKAVRTTDASPAALCAVNNGRNRSIVSRTNVTGSLLLGSNRRPDTIWGKERVLPDLSIDKWELE